MYKILLKDFDDEKENETELPFVPFIGLHIRCKFEGMNYRQVHEIYWDDRDSRFIVYTKVI